MDPSTSAESIKSGIEPRVASKRLFWVFIVGYFAIWVALPLWVDRQAPAENVALLSAARSFDWLYADRSAFAVWTVYVVGMIVPPGVTVTYLLGALCVAIMLGVVASLAREMMDSHRAVLAVLFVTCCTYYTNRLHFFGENSALTALTAAAVWSGWRALRMRSVGWWAVTGVIWGAGLLAKPLMAITIACGLVAAMSVGPRRDRPSIILILVAVVACFAIVAPSLMHLLRDQVLGSVLWRDGLLSFMQRPRRLVDYSADQALRLVPLVFLLGILLRMRTWQQSRAIQSSPAIPSLAARQFLAIYAWGPLIGVLALGLLGFDLQASWGNAFLWLLPLWFVSTRSGYRFVAVDLEHVLIGVVLTHIVMIVGYVLNW